MAKLEWDDRKLRMKAKDETIEKLKKRGMLILKDAKRYCPFDTGRLRSSISINWTGSGLPRGKDEVGEPKGGRKEFIVVVGTNVEYGVYQEYGTSKMSASPYLRPAFQKNKKAKV